MDLNYWKDYYSNNRENKQPSLFAQYIVENFIVGDTTKLIELGCGNGRDSIFFREKGLNVLAVDQVEEEIDFLENRFSEVENLKFKAADFTNLENDQMYDIVYSRFTLHSISSVEQDRVLKWAYNQLNQNGLFCIEVRGEKNNLFEKGQRVDGEKNAFIYHDHYRRFLEFTTFCQELLAIGFTLEYSKESKGFAPFQDTDEVFIRVIAKKK